MDYLKIGQTSKLFQTFFNYSESDAESGCSNVELGTPVQMDMTIRLKSCKSEIFTVSPEGINEEMVIEIEPLCECDCAVNNISNEDECRKEEKCNNSGHLICGVCQCCGDSYGENCR